MGQANKKSKIREERIRMAMERDRKILTGEQEVQRKFALYTQAVKGHDFTENISPEKTNAVSDEEIAELRLMSAITENETPREEINVLGTGILQHGQSKSLGRSFMAAIAASSLFATRSHVERKPPETLDDFKDM